MLWCNILIMTRSVRTKAIMGGHIVVSFLLVIPLKTKADVSGLSYYLRVAVGKEMKSSFCKDINPNRCRDLRLYNYETITSSYVTPKQALLFYYAKVIDNPNLYYLTEKE